MPLLEVTTAVPGSLQFPRGLTASKEALAGQTVKHRNPLPQLRTENFLAARGSTFTCNLTHHMAQPPRLEARQMSQLINEELEASSTRSSGVDDYFFALLPPSDLAAVIDLSRPPAGLLPQLKEMAPGEVGQAIAKFEQLRDKIGINLSRTRTAIISRERPRASSRFASRPLYWRIGMRIPFSSATSMARS